MTVPVPTGAPKARVLILEGHPGDAALMRRALARGGLRFTSKLTDTRAAFENALDAFGPDVVLADCRLPGFDGAEALGHVRRVHPEIPVVMVSGTLGEEAATELLKAGAKDYVLKSNLLRLPLAVERAISVERGIRARKAAEGALRASNVLLQTTERIAHIGGFDWDIASGVIPWSEETYRAFGRSPDEFTPTLASFAECIRSEEH